MLAKARSQKELSEKNQAMKQKMSAKSTRISRRRGGELIEAELLRDPEDIRLDPRYGGQTEVLLKFVPLRCVDESTDLDVATLREWVVYAIVEEDPASQRFFDSIQRYNDLIAEVEANMKKIPKLNFYDENGNLKSESEARIERERLFSKYGEDLALAEAGLDEVNTQLKEHVSWRKSMGVKLTMIDTDSNTSTSTWLLELSGTDDVQEIEDALIQKRNWQGIKLAVAYNRRDPPLPPWVGRGEVPDGKNPTLPNYTGLEVNMLGVRIMRVPAGIGLYRHLDRKNTSIAHDEFGVYYGEYEHGMKNGFGIQISDSGVYSGSFENNFRRGHGRLDFADGTTIIGNFDVKTQSSLSSTSFKNPYMDGEPHGLVEIFFSDGGYYRGHMMNGEITGQGEYQSAFNEMMSGTFKDGRLHGKNNFHQTASEDVYMGQFNEGELHGFGTFVSNRSGDSYDGYWQDHLRHGRGISKYKGVGCHRGYYVNGIKHGKGSIEFGMTIGEDFDGMEDLQQSEKVNQNEVKHDDVIDKLKSFGSKMRNLHGESASRKDRQEERVKEREHEHDFQFSEFDNIYQGFFLGGNISNQGSVMNTMKQIPTIISRLDKRKVLPIQQVINHEYHRKKRSDQSMEKYSDLEHFIRLEIYEKKMKIFKQQKHFSKKMMFDEDVYNYFDYSQYDQKRMIREERLKKMSKVSESSDQYYYKKAKIPRLKNFNTQLFINYTKSLDRLQPSNDDGSPMVMKQDDYINQELLKTIFSDFEEVRERQRFLKYDLIWQRAEAAYESFNQVDNT